MLSAKKEQIKNAKRFLLRYTSADEHVDSRGSESVFQSLGEIERAFRASLLGETRQTVCSAVVQVFRVPSL